MRYACVVNARSSPSYPTKIDTICGAKTSASAVSMTMNAAMM